MTPSHSPSRGGEPTQQDSYRTRPIVGVAVVVVKDGKILIGKDTRKGETTYGVPGGHWENGETLKECAMREVREESGILCKDLRLISVYDFYREDKKTSSVTIGMSGIFAGGEFRDHQTEGRLAWGWYTPEEALKLNLWPPDRVLIPRLFSGIIFE